MQCGSPPVNPLFSLKQFTGLCRSNRTLCLKAHAVHICPFGSFKQEKKKKKSSKIHWVQHSVPVITSVLAKHFRSAAQSFTASPLFQSASLEASLPISCREILCSFSSLLTKQWPSGSHEKCFPNAFLMGLLHPLWFCDSNFSLSCLNLRDCREVEPNFSLCWYGCSSGDWWLIHAYKYHYKFNNRSLMQKAETDL